MSNSTFHNPTELEQALQLLRQLFPQDRVVLAGGTDLMIKLNKRKCTPVHMVNICQIKKLKEISFSGESCEIGAGVTFTDLLANNEVRRYFPALVEACQQVGSKQIRNVATLGGNICNASPAADAVVALIALRAQLAIASAKGGYRFVDCAHFFTGPGKTVLLPEELVVKIILQVPKEPTFSKFLKVRRTAVDIAIVGVAAALQIDKNGRVKDGTRVVLGAVAPTPINAERTAAAVVGQRLTPELAAGAARIAVDETSPITDQRASREYRLHLVRALTEEALRSFINGRESLSC